MQKIIDIIEEKNAQGIPVYVMPVGLPGCGKSTLVAALQDEADIKILSFDAITEEFQKAHNLSYSEAFAQIPFDEKKEKFMDRRNTLTEDGANIFADATNLSGVVRGTVFDEVPQYFTVGVYFPISIEESLARCAKREAETGKHIPKEAVEKMASYMNVPEPEEFDLLFEMRDNELKLSPRADRWSEPETSQPEP